MTSPRAKTSWLALPFFCLASCGGSSGAPTPAPSTFDLPTALSEGGPVLANPRVQAIYFGGFPYQTDIDQFLKGLETSAYWPAIAAEYGVGRPRVLPADVSATTVPATLTMDGLAPLFTQVFADDAARLGAPNAETIYVLMFSPQTTITAGGATLCQVNAPAAFHMELTPANTRVAVVVIPACAMFLDRPDLTGANALTPSLSHELIEAATDPFPISAPAFSDVDAAHALWAQAVGGAEIGDLCENESPNVYVPADLPYPVQRIWSNEAAQAGRGPCVPVPAGEIYFNGVGRLPNTVPVTRNGTLITLPVLRASAGLAASVSVNFVAGAAAATWQVFALEPHGDNLGTKHSLPVQGRRGDTHTLSLSPPDATTGVFPMLLISTNAANDVHVWVGGILRQ